MQVTACKLDETTIQLVMPTLPICEGSTMTSKLLLTYPPCMLRLKLIYKLVVGSLFVYGLVESDRVLNAAGIIAVNMMPAYLC